jgi:HK97 family phage major capsid protein
MKEATMADSKTLREQMAQIATEARSKLLEVTDKTNEARAAEVEREFDAMMAEHDKLEARATRMDKAEAALRAANAIDTSKRPAVEPRSVPAADQGAVADYRSAFYAMIANGGVDGLDSEVRNALRGRELRAQTAGTTTAGGYTVPTELAAFIEKAMIASGPMYDSNLFTVINTTGGNTFNIPTVDDTASTAVAHTEGGTVTDDGGKDVTFGQKTLGAYAFDTEWVRWSYELANDSILNMESLLGELLGERMGRIANSKLTTGSGSSDVEGIVTNSAAGKTAAAVAAITADEIIDLIHSVDPAYRSAASTAIMMNDSTLSAVRKLKDGQGNYLWQMGNYQAGVPQNILGYNVVVNQAMDSLAAAKKVMLFGDMSKFYVRKVGAPTLFVARERFAPDYGILGYIRFDGVLTNTAAIKHLITAAS